jgi:hypothetical protein
MKNIHVLQTDKPSRLHYYSNVTFGVSKEHLNWKQGRNIYITSDEEIKEGDWYLLSNSNNLLIKCVNSDIIKAHPPTIDERKKIILTTDQDLIKDGVQAIDDDFLQWFVNNPSCESVEVQDWVNYYKIFIPKKEPKQETLEEAAERLSELQEGTYTIQHKTTYQHGFIDCAKWQQQQNKNKYSEEEVIQILINYLHYLTTNDGRPSEEWFEQFKKK